MCFSAAFAKLNYSIHVACVFLYCITTISVYTRCALFCASDKVDEKAKFWPAQLHIVGKDITWFHTVIWPCMLMWVTRLLKEHFYS